MRRKGTIFAGISILLLIFSMYCQYMWIDNDVRTERTSMSGTFDKGTLNEKNILTLKSEGSSVLYVTYDLEANQGDVQMQIVDTVNQKVVLEKVGKQIVLKNERVVLEEGDYTIGIRFLDEDATSYSLRQEIVYRENQVQFYK